MQNAATVLGVLRERGRKGLPCDELYRQMFNRELYLLAYGRIYANEGAMTPGASAETADGMSEDKIDGIIEAIRYERYRFSPVRRIFIPKKNGKLRPLGLPSWSDKLVGEVVRLVMADLTLKPPMIQFKINTSTDRGPRPVSRRPNKRSRPVHSYGVLCCQGACGDLPLGVARQAVSGGRGCMEAGGRNCPGSGRLTTHGRDSDTRIGYLHDGVFVGNGPLSRKRASPGIPPCGCLLYTSDAA